MPQCISCCWRWQFVLTMRPLHFHFYLFCSQDYTHEFHKTKGNFLAIREREDLLGSVRKDIEWVSSNTSLCHNCGTVFSVVYFSHCKCNSNEQNYWKLNIVTVEGTVNGWSVPADSLLLCHMRLYMVLCTKQIISSGNALLVFDFSGCGGVKTAKH